MALSYILALKCKCPVLSGKTKVFAVLFSQGSLCVALSQYSFLRYHVGLCSLLQTPVMAEFCQQKSKDTTAKSFNILSSRCVIEIFRNGLVHVVCEQICLNLNTFLFCLQSFSQVIFKVLLWYFFLFINSVTKDFFESANP